jgi:hypothetical protein
MSIDEHKIMCGVYGVKPGEEFEIKASKESLLNYLDSKIKEIENNRNDDEAAHSLEDSLHEECFKMIVKYKEYAIEIASKALSTSKISFSRWCA